MIKKRKVELGVFDVDSTLSDFYGLVNKTSGVVLKDIEKEFNIPRKQLIKEIQEVSQQKTFEYFFHNPVKLMEVLPCVQDKDEKIKAKILHKWDINRKKLCKMFPGVQETFEGLKNAGGKVAILSDSPITPGIVRLRLMGLNPDSVDAIYMRSDPKIPNDNRPLFEYTKEEAEYYNKLKSKIVIIPDNFRKPLPDILKFISQDLGAKEDRTIMVGDTDKDILCCQGNKCISVLHEQGANLDKETVALFEEMSIVPGYSVGLNVVNEKLKKAGVEPDVRLSKENGLLDMPKFFEYVPVKENNRKTLSEKEIKERQEKIIRILENKNSTITKKQAATNAIQNYNKNCR